MSKETTDYSFRFRNLHTSYLFNIDVYKEGDKPLTIKSFAGRTKNTPCFRRLFNYLDGYSRTIKLNAAVGIFINASREIAKQNNINNLVLLNKNTIIRHLEEAKKVVDFEYKITKRKNYFIRLNILGGNSIQVKFLCSWVRYMYEFPANVLLLDAYRLIDAGKFTNESMFNLIMVLNTTLSRTTIRSDQCIRLLGKLQSDETLRKKLNTGYKTLNALYEDIRDYFSDKSRKIVSELSTEEYSLNYWLNEDNLVDRYFVYENALKYYKEQS